MPGPFITHPMVKWLGQLCGTLETLTVDIKMKRNGGMLPQFLMAAQGAIRLHSLKFLGQIESADLCSLAFLRQVRQLSLEDCQLFGEGPQLHGIQCLSGLQSLQVSSFLIIHA